MAASLNGALIHSYREHGYLSPLNVLAEEELRGFRRLYDEFEASLGDTIRQTPPRRQHVLFSETHVYIPWVYQLVTDANVLDAVGSLLGPDLLIWNTRWFTKRPGDKTFITWHQDGSYWGLKPPDVCTAWIALSYSTEANGCMWVVPGSHRADVLPHRETADPDNALGRGQEIAVDIDETRAVPLTLNPGQMSVHHIGIVHGSRPNRSNVPRIGLAVRFITPEVVQDVESADAMLVRGEDRLGHFNLLIPPRSGDDPAELARRGRAVVERMSANLHADYDKSRQGEKQTR